MSGGQRPLLVGVDIGTSTCKAVVHDAAGAALQTARTAMPWTTVATGAQLDPAAVHGVVADVVHRALDGAPDAPVAAVGVASIAESGVLTDGRGTAVAPVIAWHDHRGAQDATALGEALGVDVFAVTTGLALRPLCSAAKVRWLLRTGSVTGPARRWHGLAEWAVHGLGGDPQPERSLASRTGWLQIREGTWWEACVAASGGDAALPGPTPVAAGTPMGRVATGPQRLRGAVLTVAGHDHQVAALGAGVTAPGAVFDSCGSAEALVAALPALPAAGVVGRLVADGMTVGCHAAAGRWALLAAQRAGLALQRVADVLDLDGDRRDAVDGAAALERPGGLRVVGLEDATATIEGIGWSPSSAQVWRAAVETVTDRTAQLLADIESVTGVTRRLVVGGGWARSRALSGAKRARLGALSRCEVVEPGCRGAALLAAVAAGLYGSVDDLPPP